MMDKEKSLNRNRQIELLGRHPQTRFVYNQVVKVVRMDYHEWIDKVFLDVLDREQAFRLILDVIGKDTIDSNADRKAG